MSPSLHPRLSFVGARLANAGGYALAADGLTVEQNMVCRAGFVAEGEVNLSGGRIGGSFDLDGQASAIPTARRCSTVPTRAT